MRKKDENFDILRRLERAGLLERALIEEAEGDPTKILEFFRPLPTPTVKEETDGNSVPAKPAP